MSDLPIKLWTAAKTDRVGPVLGWNIPLALALLGYFIAYGKLLFLQESGLTIALWNEETERAIGLTTWTHDHLWVFLIFAIVHNSVFLIKPRRKLWRYARLGIFVLLTFLAFWYFGLESYLSNKVLGPPREQSAVTTPAAK